MAVLLLFSACGSREARRMLDRAEAVMSEDPSEAIAILDSISDDGLSRSQRMHMELLRAEAMNLTYQSMDTLSGMEYVADYYRPFWGHSHRYMRSLYMLGCVFRDRGDAPTAIQYYQEAANQADTTQADCNFYTLCRIYGQMAVLFQKQRSPRQELEVERKAYDAAMKAKDTLAAISYYKYMAGAYYALGMKDSALTIVENAISLYTKRKEKSKAAAEMGVASDFYIKKKDFRRADSLLKQYEAYSGFFDNNGKITPGRETYYYTKGLYYQGIQETDSAIFYYRKLLSPLIDIEDVELGYKGLMSVYHHLGKADSTLKYANLYAQANDSANILHSADEITRTQALYNYTQFRLQAEQERHHAMTNLYVAFALGVILCILMLIIYLGIIQVRHHREKVQIAEQQLHTRLSELEHQLTIKEMMDVEKEMMDSPLVNSFHEMAKSSVKKPTLDEWSQLRSFLRDKLPAFWDKLHECEPPLRIEEIDVCLLIRLQFKAKDIANLTGMSLQSISNIRRRLLQRVFHQSEGGSKEFDRLIMKL